MGASAGHAWLRLGGAPANGGASWPALGGGSSVALEAGEQLVTPLGSHQQSPSPCTGWGGHRVGAACLAVEAQLATVVGRTGGGTAVGPGLVHERRHASLPV